MRGEEMPVQVTRKGSEIVAVVTETGAGAASETEIPLGIARGRILRMTTVLTSGTASTVDPIVGIATNPAGFNVVIENGTAAATIDNSYAGGITFSSSGSLFQRSKPDAGSDNAITTVYHIAVGW
jgi:hypothetical protein